MGQICIWLAWTHLHGRKSNTDHLPKDDHRPTTYKFCLVCWQTGQQAEALGQVAIGDCGVQVDEEKMVHTESKSLGKREENIRENKFGNPIVYCIREGLRSLIVLGKVKGLSIHFIRMRCMYLLLNQWRRKVSSICHLSFPLVLYCKSMLTSPNLVVPWFFFSKEPKLYINQTPTL